MINAEVTARTGAPDATGAGKGFAAKQGRDAEGSGFSDTLSHVGGGQRDAATAGAASEVDAAGETQTPDAAPDTDTDAPVVKGRSSALELTARVLFGKSEDGGRTATSVKQIIGNAGTTVKQPDTDDLTVASVSGRPSKAEIASATKTVRTDKVDGEEAGKTAAVAGEAVGEAKEAGLSEMLSLLSGAAASEQAAGVAPRATGQGRERVEGRGEKIVGSATEGRAAQASAAAKASDALEISTDSDAALVDERTFRLSSDRGSGQALDMKIGVDEQGKVGFDTAAAGGGNAENVVVLDSRRFLGFGQGTNGAALTAAMSGDKSWAAAMSAGASSLADPLASSTGNVVNTLKLQLNPQDLGSVTATLRLSGEALSVHLTVENHAAYRHLSDDSTGMVEALRSQGFAVDQVTISVTSGAQQDASGQQSQQQGQQPGQSAQQQAAAQDGRQGNGAGREQNQANARSMPGDGARGTNEQVSDTVAAGGARPEQLYL